MADIDVFIEPIFYLDGARRDLRPVFGQDFESELFFFHEAHKGAAVSHGDLDFADALDWDPDAVPIDEGGDVRKRDAHRPAAVNVGGGCDAAGGRVHLYHGYAVVRHGDDAGIYGHFYGPDRRVSAHGAHAAVINKKEPHVAVVRHRRLQDGPVHVVVPARLAQDHLAQAVIVFPEIIHPIQHTPAPYLGQPGRDKPDRLAGGVSVNDVDHVFKFQHSRRFLHTLNFLRGAAGAVARQTFSRRFYDCYTIVVNTQLCFSI
ncbi:hypothetical protein SDC9_130572 [bioreactor metagenome]|uniref:Uncharacterized protein n=1 Tax=bioreactor metagenome TaxID=1076179 RepID=A0A645D362_9ZZZZ